MCVLFDLIRQHNNCLIEELNITSEIENLFKRNGYIKTWNRFDGRNTTIEFKKHSTKDGGEDIYSDYIDENLLSHQRMTEIPPILFGYISSLFSELFSNVQQHTKANHVTTCGQFYPSKNILKFSLGNLTKTFHEVIATENRENMTEIECIKWALAPENSTKKDKNKLGGSGLTLLKQLIEDNHGKLVIISGKAYYEENYLNSNEKYVEQILDYGVPGTIISLTFNLGTELVIDPTKPLPI